MTKDEIIAEILKRGIRMHPRTIWSYEKNNLIPIANRQSAGRPGRSTSYSETAFFEIIAAWNLMNSPQVQFSKECVECGRYYALNGETAFVKKYGNMGAFALREVGIFAAYWQLEYDKACNGLGRR